MSINNLEDELNKHEGNLEDELNRHPNDIDKRIAKDVDARIREIDEKNKNSQTQNESTKQEYVNCYGQMVPRQDFEDLRQLNKKMKFNVYYEINNGRLVTDTDYMFLLPNQKLLVKDYNTLNKLDSPYYEIEGGRITLLSFGAGDLKTIPYFTFDLTELKELNLNLNKLTEISKGISKLKNLETLKLQSNKLKKLPEELLKLEYLTEVYAPANPFTNYSVIKKLHNKGVNVITEY